MTKHVTIDKKDMPKWFFTEQIEAQRQRAEKAEAERDELEAKAEQLERENSRLNGELIGYDDQLDRELDLRARAEKAEARVKELEAFKRWFALFEEQAMHWSDHQVMSFCKAVRQNTDYEIKEKGDE